MSLSHRCSNYRENTILYKRKIILKWLPSYSKGPQAAVAWKEYRITDPHVSSQRKSASSRMQRQTCHFHILTHVWRPSGARTHPRSPSSQNVWGLHESWLSFFISFKKSHTKGFLTSWLCPPPTPTLWPSQTLRNSKKHTHTHLPAEVGARASGFDWFQSRSNPVCSLKLDSCLHIHEGLQPADD